jgi:hypothetical protein
MGFTRGKRMSELMKNEAFLKSRDEEIARVREALTKNFNETMDATEKVVKGLEVEAKDIGAFGDHLGAIMVGNAIGQSIAGMRKFCEVLREESNYTPERALRILITSGYAYKVLAVVDKDIADMKATLEFAKEKIAVLEKELEAKKEKTT